MGFRFQKRIRLLPGLRLNLSRKGASVTLGKPGLSVNFGKDGTTGTVGIPGTGLSYREKWGGSPPAEDTARMGSDAPMVDAQIRPSLWKWLFFAAVLVIVLLVFKR